MDFSPQNTNAVNFKYPDQCFAFLDELLIFSDVISVCCFLPNSQFKNRLQMFLNL